jgi:hypothetical protein
LSRPEYTVFGDVAQGLARTQIKAFLDLEQREPGQWSFAQGENSILIGDQVLLREKGALVDLYRAIPVPNKDVPLDDILDFKIKRHDELNVLRAEVDTFLNIVNGADNREDELNRQVALLDAACADVLRIFKEWRFPFRLLNLKISYDFRPLVTMLGGVVAVKGLPITSALVASLAGAAIATAPAIKITGDFGWQGLRHRLGPYRYVSHYHHELFGI